MCFSASASFAAGGVLAVIGMASIKKAPSPAEVVFACIPLIFSVQQISEGFLWLSLTDPGYAGLQQLTAYIFLFFGQVLWPVWIPLSILLIEKENKRKKMLRIFVAIGAAVAVYFAFCLLAYPVEAKLTGHHIAYVQEFPVSTSAFIGIPYLIATITPAFFSGVKRMWILSIVLLASYMISTIFYRDHFVSVWCFFATAISLVVLMIIYETRKVNRIISAQA
jgi:hypothetical protein